MTITWEWFFWRAPNWFFPFTGHCACILSLFNHVRLFVTLWTGAHQAPLSMGFSREEFWSGLPCATPGDLPDLGIEPASLMPPALAGRFFTTNTTWKDSFHCSCRLLFSRLARSWREGLEGSKLKCHKTLYSYWYLSAFLDKYFLDCCKPLVNLQSSEKVGFWQFSLVLYIWNNRFLKFITKPFPLISLWLMLNLSLNTLLL